MKYLNREDKKTRHIVNNFFEQKLDLKNFRLLNKTNVDLQKNCAFTLLKMPRLSGLSRPKNRCIISCKGRAVLRRYRLSHTTIRELYPKGIIPGLYKKSF